MQVTNTSVPYWCLRTYDGEDRFELGHEPNVELYIENLRKVFIEVKRVTKFRGSVFVNIADTYRSGADNLIPEKFCLMMAEIGLHRINAIPWVKTSNLARAAENRRLNPTWENLFHFVKTEAASLNLPEPERYLYQPFLYYPEDRKIKVGKIGGRQNRDGTRTKQKINVSKAFKRLEAFFDNHSYFDVIKTANAGADVSFLKKEYGAEHVAPFPLEIPLYGVLTCSQAAANGGEEDTIFDPFMGSGTTAAVALLMGRKAVGYEKFREYYELSVKRCTDIVNGLEELKVEKGVTPIQEKPADAA